MAIKEFGICIKPDPKIEIWRYMDLEKFEFILKNKALFFCRADRFVDPFEGSLPKRELDLEMREKHEYLIHGLSYLRKRMKMQNIINCWHISNSENDSMWKLYLKSNEGIAIKTTVKRLIESFKNTEERVVCSMVRYLDYENDVWYNKDDYPLKAANKFVPLVHKRIEYATENELRLIHAIDSSEFPVRLVKHTTDSNYPDHYWESQPFEKGKNISVDLEVLISEIVFAPTCDEFQVSKIKEIIKKYGYNFNSNKSVLNNQPYY
jgi:hypothetical protein